LLTFFSKFAWAAESAVQNVIQKSKRKPKKFWVDQGSEFYNKAFQTWIKKEGMTMYSTHGESKSMVVERFIRTLKDITTKYFTEHSTRDWVNNITKFLQIYNNRKQ